MQEKQHSKVEPYSTWSKQEKWVWSRISEGEVANFNKAEGYGGKLDPKKPNEWPEGRILTPSFLEAILLDEPFRGALSRHGVRIIGARFKDPIDLSNTILAMQLWLESSRFDSEVHLSSLKTSSLISIEGSSFNSILYMNGLQSSSSLFMRNGAEFDEVVLIGARIDGTLEMDGSKFKGKLDMNSLQVDRSLHMRNGAEFDEVVLIGAKIGETLDMDGSKFKGKLDIRSSKVGSNLYMRNGAEFNEVVLSARIDGTLEMDGSKFKGKLHMNSLQVGSSLYMRNGAEFNEVILNSIKVGGTLDMNSSNFNCKLIMNKLQVFNNLYMRDGARFDEITLIGARIGGSLEMDGSKFNGAMYMENLKVAENLFLRNCKVKNKLYLIFTRIGISLYISDSEFRYLNLTGTQINEDLCLGSGKHPPAKWEKGSTLILRNTKVGVLQDLPNAWPDEIELIGFTYSQLGGLDEGEAYSMPKRDIPWMKEWMEKQKHYSPQPYEQLGKVLREAGYKNKANDILLESKERERSETKKRARSETKSWLAWLSLTSQFYSVGFGYRYQFAFYWVIALTLIGTFVLWSTGQGLANGMPYGFSYSLDMLLPIIKLNESHYIIKLTGFAKYYFYIHILLGYVLASFLIAGLSGITKK